MTCNCRVFRENGICYHTGYRPSFSIPAAYRPEVPEAVTRTQRYQRQNQDRWNEEDRQQDQQRKVRDGKR